MTRFLVDAQLPPALARWLEAQGHMAEHVFEFDGDGTTDGEIWMRALSTGAIIVSKDEDFPLRAIRDVRALDVVQALRPSDFYKSMTTTRNHRAWQDVYRARWRNTEIYLKFQQHEDAYFFTVSFKEL